ncbi:MAG TPA: hypothetical protein VNE39_05745, partial [Planctomycetota bacterium]|nr:hypothetical protein [Planctomycetota bacterium]
MTMQRRSPAGGADADEQSLIRQKAAMDIYSPEADRDLEAAVRHLNKLLAGRDDIVDIGTGNRFGEGVITVCLHPDYPFRRESLPGHVDGWRIHATQLSQEELPRVLKRQAVQRAASASEPLMVVRTSPQFVRRRPAKAVFYGLLAGLVLFAIAAGVRLLGG